MEIMHMLKLTLNTIFINCTSKTHQTQEDEIISTNETNDYRINNAWPLNEHDYYISSQKNLDTQILERIFYQYSLYEITENVKQGRPTENSLEKMINKNDLILVDEEKYLDLFFNSSFDEFGVEQYEFSSWIEQKPNTADDVSFIMIIEYKLFYKNLLSDYSDADIKQIFIPFSKKYLEIKPTNCDFNLNVFGVLFFHMWCILCKYRKLILFRKDNELLIYDYIANYEDLFLEDANFILISEVSKVIQNFNIDKSDIDVQNHKYTASTVFLRSPKYKNLLSSYWKLVFTSLMVMWREKDTAVYIHLFDKNLETIEIRKMKLDFTFSLLRPDVYNKYFFMIKQKSFSFDLNMQKQFVKLHEILIDTMEGVRKDEIIIISVTLDLNFMLITMIVNWISEKESSYDFSENYSNIMNVFANKHNAIIVNWLNALMNLMFKVNKIMEHPILQKEEIHMNSKVMLFFVDNKLPENYFLEEKYMPLVHNLYLKETREKVRLIANKCKHDVYNEFMNAYKKLNYKYTMLYLANNKELYKNKKIKKSILKDLYYDYITNCDYKMIEENKRIGSKTLRYFEKSFYLELENSVKQVITLEFLKKMFSDEKTAKQTYVENLTKFDAKSLSNNKKTCKDRAEEKITQRTTKKKKPKTKLALEPAKIAQNSLVDVKNIILEYAEKLINENFVHDKSDHSMKQDLLHEYKTISDVKIKNNPKNNVKIDDPESKNSKKCVNKLSLLATQKQSFMSDVSSPYKCDDEEMISSKIVNNTETNAESDKKLSRFNISTKSKKKYKKFCFSIYKKELTKLCKRKIYINKNNLNEASNNKHLITNEPKINFTNNTTQINFNTHFQKSDVIDKCRAEIKSKIMKKLAVNNKTNTFGLDKNYNDEIKHIMKFETKSRMVKAAKYHTRMFFNAGSRSKHNSKDNCCEKFRKISPIENDNVCKTVPNTIVENIMKKFTILNEVNDNCTTVKNEILIKDVHRQQLDDINEIEECTNIFNVEKTHHSFNNDDKNEMMGQIINNTIQNNSLLMHRQTNNISVSKLTTGPINLSVYQNKLNAKNPSKKKHDEHKQEIIPENISQHNNIIKYSSSANVNTQNASIATHIDSAQNSIGSKCDSHADTNFVPNISSNLNNDKKLKENNDLKQSEQKEAAINQKETAIERIETAIEQKAAAINQKEITIEQNETAIEQKESAIEQKETPIVLNSAIKNKKPYILDTSEINQNYIDSSKVILKNGFSLENFIKDCNAAGNESCIDFLNESLVDDSYNLYSFKTNEHENIETKVIDEKYTGKELQKYKPNLMPKPANKFRNVPKKISNMQKVNNENGELNALEIVPNNYDLAQRSAPFYVNKFMLKVLCLSETCPIKYHYIYPVGYVPTLDVTGLIWYIPIYNPIHN